MDTTATEKTPQQTNTTNNQDLQLPWVEKYRPKRCVSLKRSKYS